MSFLICPVRAVLTSNPNHILMTGRRLQMRKHRRSRIRLQVLVVCNELNYPVPHFRPDMITRRRDELQYRIDIPLVLPSATRLMQILQLTSVANRSVKIAIFNTISSRRL